MKRGVIVGMFAALSVAAVAMLGVLTFYTATDHLNAAREAAQVDKSELKAQVTAGVLIALIENPQVCSPKFLTCEQRSV